MHRRFVVAIALGGCRSGVRFGLRRAPSLGLAQERQADQSKDDVHAKGDDCGHGQVRNRTPGAATHLEQQLEGTDRHGRGQQVAGRVDYRGREQQHDAQQAQRFAQVAPHPAGDAKPHQNAAQGGEGVDTPGEEIVVLGHGVRGMAGK